MGDGTDAAIARITTPRIRELEAEVASLKAERNDMEMQRNLAQDAHDMTIERLRELEVAKENMSSRFVELQDDFCVVEQAATEAQDRVRELEAAGEKPYLALEHLWGIVQNDVPCPPERPCEICQPAYVEARAALDGAWRSLIPKDQA